MRGNGFLIVLKGEWKKLSNSGISMKMLEFEDDLFKLEASGVKEPIFVLAEARADVTLSRRQSTMGTIIKENIRRTQVCKASCSE